MDLDIEDQYDKIYRYCYFKVNNIQLAEDLTQETFLRFFNPNNYKEKGKPLAYLYTIARNLCIDYYKKDKKLISYNPACITDYNIDTFEKKYILREAINHLSDDLKEIILLRYANQLKIGEIAELMGVSRFVIHRKIKKALNELQEIIGEE